MEGEEKESTGFPTASPQEGGEFEASEEHVTEMGSAAKLEVMPSPALQGEAWQDDPAVLEWQVQADKPSDQDRWHMEVLEQALPQPIMYHELLWRDWEDLCDQQPIREKHFDFSVLSYNILAQDLVNQNPELYQHCDPFILSWEYRWGFILQELQHWEADIVCLQEVQEDHYTEHIHPSLSALGYSCHYKRRTGRKTDGCCTCYKTQMFTLLHESHVEFFRPGIDLLNRDNVGLVLLLRPLSPEGLEDAPSPLPLCVANTHLLYNPRRGDIKLAQLAFFLAEIDKVSRTPMGSHCPIILCGDLNATPRSPLYRLLSDGWLNYSGLPAGKVSGQERDYNNTNWRTIPSPLLPDIVGVTDCCQYAILQSTQTLDVPKQSARCTYSRQQLLKLRYCDCTLQRPPDVPVIKGVTDNKPDPIAEPTDSVLSESFPEHHTPHLRSPFLLQHNLNLTSAYSHFLLSKGREEITTLPMGIGSTVDYIFYSAQPVIKGSTRHGVRFFQDNQLKLLGRLCLLSADDLWGAQGLPNAFFCSDHLCLLVRFRLDLSIV
ncbi:protein angel homolog 1 isoform 2-T2 [Rhinophrynus dorsalis]